MADKSRDCLEGELLSSNYTSDNDCPPIEGANPKKRTICYETKLKLKRIALSDITNIKGSPAKFRSSDRGIHEQTETTFPIQVASRNRSKEQNVKLLCNFGHSIEREGALPRPDYFEIVQKSKDGPFTREVVTKWFFRIVDELKLSYNTAFLATGYFDRFLSKVKVKNQFLPILSRACLFVAAKFWECNPPSPKQLFSNSKLGTQPL